MAYVITGICEVCMDCVEVCPTECIHPMEEPDDKEGKQLYIPPGFAHGYQTLESNTEIYYMMTEEYKPGHADGFRWNDPAFAIEWPEEERVILDRDNSYLDFDASKVHGFFGYYG